MSADASAVVLSVVDAAVVDVFAVFLLVVVCADAVVDVVVLVVVVVLMMLFDPFLPGVVADDDEVDVKVYKKAVLDVLRDVLH